MIPAWVMNRVLHYQMALQGQYQQMPSSSHEVHIIDNQLIYSSI